MHLHESYLTMSFVEHRDGMKARKYRLCIHQTAIYSIFMQPLRPTEFVYKLYTQRVRTRRTISVDFVLAINLLHEYIFSPRSRAASEWFVCGPAMRDLLCLFKLVASHIYGTIKHICYAFTTEDRPNLSYNIHELVAHF